MIKINGTVHEVTFYMVNGKEVMRAKSSLDKERVTTDPKFENSKKAGKDFGTASAGAKDLRTAFRLAADIGSNPYIQGDLTKLFRKLLQTDTIHSAGSKSLNDADMSGLRGFEWNNETSFSSILRKPIEFKLDNSTGTVEVHVPAFEPKGELAIPGGATHFELMVTAAGINFETRKRNELEDRTDWLPLGASVPTRVMGGKIAMEKGMKLFAGIGIRFGQEANGTIYELENKVGKAFVIG